MKKLLLLLCCFSVIEVNAQHPRVVIDEVIRKLDEFAKIERASDTQNVKSPFGSLSEADLLRRFSFYKAQHDQLSTIDASKLKLEDRIDLELLRYSLQDDINYYQFKEYMNPILSDNGFHTRLPFDAARQYSTAKELRGYINKLKAYPAFVSENINWMRKGLETGISQPIAALSGYENTYNSLITTTAEASVFFQPFKVRPSAISETEWQQLVAEGKSAIMEYVMPAYHTTKAFFEKEYFPKARKTLSVTEFPDGKVYYAALVKHHTTTEMSPDSIFNIGMREVKRIRTAMDAVMKEVGFDGTFPAFLHFLRTDAKFYATTPEELLKEAAYISKKIDGKLPLLFGKLPRQPYGVLPVPGYLAPTYTTGRYSGAPIGSKNSGSYWVNTYDLKSRTLYTLEALTLHEAVPGHHLQTALAQELTHLPKFRQGFYVNAFGEGWGLYSEYLGTELGLYTDPYSKFGRLTYEMWRACRLVIDVGIHAKGWTREQAVSFLADNSALSLHEVNTEVNRYITWPGQALAYKIGELQIIELRRKAEERLQQKFDVRAFHDLVLSQGSVTLSILALMVDDWIQKELAK